jgi:hypothetical protein
MTNPDECNVVDELIGHIKVLVDDELSNFVNLAIALQIDVSSIHQILLSQVLSAQIFPFRVDDLILPKMFLSTHPSMQ